MTDDLVKRLREDSDVYGDWICGDAADRIEQLQADLAAERARIEKEAAAAVDAERVRLQKSGDAAIASQEARIKQVRAALAIRGVRNLRGLHRALQRARQ